jgi:sulfite reductase beta subunit-like hemoprotein
MAKDAKTVFPCARIPEDHSLQRLVGLYPQRQEGLWMQRIKIPGGALTGDQWRALAGIARRHTPGTPIHLTTRQDIELHNVAPQNAAQVQRAVADAGLTGLGACGDTLRNVTVCSCSGVAVGCPDLGPLGEEIRKTIQSLPGAFALPRKLKISLSACPAACAQPWINDLGLVARKRDGRWGFFAAAGGSLGTKAATGIEVAEWLAPGDVLPLVAGVVGVFAEHGDRSNRKRARLRHFRERVGDERFREMILAAWAEAKAEQHWPETALAEPADGLAGSAALTFTDGDITPEAADSLARLTDRDDLAMRISSHHRVMIFARDGSAAAEAAAGQAALAEAARPQAAVVACPGTHWCARGLADTRAMAALVRSELAGDLSPEKVVAISGCPHGCAQSGVAPVGLVGGLATRDGRKSEVYNLLVGGRMGRDEKVAAPAGRKLLPAEVIESLKERSL